MKTLTKFLQETKQHLSKKEDRDPFWHENIGLTKKQYQDNLKHYKPEHDEIIGNYKENSDNFNYDLRISHHDHILHNNPEMVKNLDKITNHSLKHDYTVYRSFNDYHNELKNLKPGDVFTDHGYSSTTLNPDVAKEYSHNFITARNVFHKYYAKIHVPAGSKGHFLDLPQRTHDYNNEQELLLHRGTKFRVERQEHYGEVEGEVHHHIIHLKVIGNSPKQVVQKKI